MKINLGCGDEILEGYENYDLFSNDKRVKKLDLNSLPLPFEDSSVDEIKIFHILEHLDINPLEFIRDCRRILKPNGFLHVKLPTCSNTVGHLRYNHHINYLNAVFDHSFDKDVYYSGNWFSLVSLKKNRKCNLKRFLWRFKTRLISTFDSIFYTEYEWFLKKRDE